MILLLTTGYVIDMYAQSQTIEVTGMVRDAEKIPLAGVNISVKNVAGLRVSQQHEQRGLDYTEHAELSYPEFQSDLTFDADNITHRH